MEVVTEAMAATEAGKSVFSRSHSISLRMLSGCCADTNQSP